MLRIWTRPVNWLRLFLGILALLVPGVLVATGLPGVLRIYREFHLYDCRWYYAGVLALCTLAALLSALLHWQSPRGLRLPFGLVWFYLMVDRKAKGYRLVRRLLRFLHSRNSASAKRRRPFAAPGVSHRYLLYVYAEILAQEFKLSQRVERLDIFAIHQPASSFLYPKAMLHGYQKDFQRYCQLILLALEHGYDAQGAMDERQPIAIGLLALINHCRAEWITFQSFGLHSQMDYAALLKSYSQMITGVIRGHGKDYLSDLQERIATLLEQPAQPDALYQQLGDIYGLLGAGNQLPHAEEPMGYFWEARDLLTEEGCWSALFISQSRWLCEGLVRSHTSGNGAEEMVSLYQSLERHAPLALGHPRIAYTYAIAWKYIAKAMRPPQTNAGAAPGSLKQAAETFARLQATDALVKAGAQTWFDHSIEGAE